MPSIFFLALHQLINRWRIIGLIVVAAVPILVAIGVSAIGEFDKPDANDLDDLLIATTLAAAAIPIITLIGAVPLFSNEIEDKTLGNLILTPLKRWQIVAAKLIAAKTISVPLILASTFIAVFVAFEGSGLNNSIQAAAATAIGLGLGSLMYITVFSWLGLATRWPLIIGVIYIFIWEGIFSTYVQNLKYLSLRKYSLSIVHEINPDLLTSESSADLIARTPTVVGAITILIAFSFLTIRRLQKVEIP